jgi:RNA polymerase sigma factor (sigma-70 family)
MTDMPEPWKPAAGEAEAAWQTALSGDREAFQKAVAPYLEELFKAARRERRYRIALGDLTADDLTAEEIAGETLIRAWDDRHDRPPELGLKAWLLAGMFRVVEDIVRREGRFRRTAAVSLERPVPPDPVYDDEGFWEWYQPDEVTRWEDVLADAEPTPEEMAATDEEFNRSLPPLAREAFLLHEVHNVPVREVALALHVPERQVMHLLAEARKRLRRAARGEAS